MLTCWPKVTWGPQLDIKLTIRGSESPVAHTQQKLTHIAAHSTLITPTLLGICQII